MRDGGADAVQPVVHHRDHERRELVDVEVERVGLVGVVLLGVEHDGLRGGACVRVELVNRSVSVHADKTIPSTLDTAMRTWSLASL